MNLFIYIYIICRPYLAGPIVVHRLIDLLSREYGILDHDDGNINLPIANGPSKVAFFNPDEQKDVFGLSKECTNNNSSECNEVSSLQRQRTTEISHFIRTLKAFKGAFGALILMQRTLTTSYTLLS